MTAMRYRCGRCGRVGRAREACPRQEIRFEMEALRKRVRPRYMGRDEYDDDGTDGGCANGCGAAGGRLRSVSRCAKSSGRLPSALGRESESYTKQRVISARLFFREYRCSKKKVSGKGRDILWADLVRDIWRSIYERPEARSDAYAGITRIESPVRETNMRETDCDETGCVRK